MVSAAKFLPFDLTHNRVAYALSNK
jgi:hypothetical protein